MSELSDAADTMVAGMEVDQVGQNFAEFARKAEPLYRAAEAGQVDELRTLAEGDRQGRELAPFVSPALVLAVEGGHKDAVAVLLEQRADPNFAPKKDAYPNALHTAARRGRLDLCTVLLAAGANTRLPFKGMTAIDAAEAAGFPAVASVLRLHHPPSSLPLSQVGFVVDCFFFGKKTRVAVSSRLQSRLSPKKRWTSSNKRPMRRPGPSKRWTMCLWTRRRACRHW